MALDEKGTGKARFDMIVLVSGPSVLAPSEKGTVYLSGPNVWFFNGSNQVLIK